jgi:hypothetical protein
MSNGLTKENFWDELEELYPAAIEHFKKWIDRYKLEIGWNELFSPGVKFHNLPFDLQNGIIARYDLECFNGKEKADLMREVEPARMRDLFADVQNAIRKRQIKLN